MYNMDKVGRNDNLHHRKSCESEGSKDACHYDLRVIVHRVEIL